MRQKFNIEINSDKHVGKELIKALLDILRQDEKYIKSYKIIELKESKRKMLKDAETRLFEALKYKETNKNSNSSFSGFLDGYEIAEIEEEIKEIKRL